MLVFTAVVHVETMKNVEFELAVCLQSCVSTKTSISERV